MITIIFFGPSPISMTLNCQVCFESFCQAQAQTKAARPEGLRTVSSAWTNPVMSWVAPTIHSSPGLVSNSSAKVKGCLLVTTGFVWLHIAMAGTHVLHLRKEHPLKQQKIRKVRATLLHVYIHKSRPDLILNFQIWGNHSWGFKQIISETWNQAIPWIQCVTASWIECHPPL